MSALTQRIRRTAPRLLAEDPTIILDLCDHAEALEAENQQLKARLAPPPRRITYIDPEPEDAVRTAMPAT
ncbi:hypothetical protein LVY72_20745 [Arthrobacter sp. I2-34]|uniref:Uncharacterized protein n=1 Tax=Arthrobacter hankyongi TaxID=2904801 RepID=A0ABS9LCB5_9MICC|nr:hypothetical protein [Arthrobacter hankyongi]MCG2624323.1 hypothetical protein [Arthrobacter hankyongi]